MSVKQLVKRGLLSAVSGVTGRTAVLLPPQADGQVPLLAVQAPYRVSGDVLRFHLGEPRAGEVSATFLADGLSRTSHPLRFSYAGPGTAALRLDDGHLAFEGRDLGSISGGDAITARRFSVAFRWRGGDGAAASRVTSHYLPRIGQAIDEAYFGGEDYVDYEAQSEGVHAAIFELVRRHRIRGPMLEIGCATGGTLAALRGKGFEVSGVDVSSWAVDQARARLGNVVEVCDVEKAPIPSAIAERGPFGCFVLASVLEHFADPEAVLSSLAPLAAPGAAIVILTTNADSLTNRLFGTDWEGHFDWTHKSVDMLTVSWLRTALERLGWTVRELRTWHLWDVSGDPTHATLRDWFAADARFRALLEERNLGDFMGCVATRA